MPRFSRLICAALALVLAAQAELASAAPVNVVTTVAYRYLPGDSDGSIPLVIDQGDQLHLVNADPLGTHNLVSLDTADGVPLFDSGEQTMLGTTSEVLGVPALGPGAYVFYCSVHGFDSMNGVLEVR